MVELKQGDTSRPITDSLLLGGAPIDLTDCTVVLLLKDENGSAPIIRQTAAITDAHNGKVQYQPVNSDVAKPVIFELEWEVTFSNGSQLTVPTHGYGRLRINRNLAN